MESKKIVYNSDFLSLSLSLSLSLLSPLSLLSLSPLSPLSLPHQIRVLESSNAHEGMCVVQALGTGEVLLLPGDDIHTFDTLTVLFDFKVSVRACVYE